jgi:hypothetical protein
MNQYTTNQPIGSTVSDEPLNTDKGLKKYEVMEKFDELIIALKSWINQQGQGQTVPPLQPEVKCKKVHDWGDYCDCQPEVKEDCDHQCSGNCRRKGCHCGCGEFHVHN